MRPFGCPAYAHIPKQHCKKLTFLGYCTGIKAYKLWDSLRHRAVKARDVIFDERVDPPQQTPYCKASDLYWREELSSNESPSEECPTNSQNTATHDTNDIEPTSTSESTLTPVPSSDDPQPQMRKRRRGLELLGPAEDLPPTEQTKLEST